MNLEKECQEENRGENVRNMFCRPAVIKANSLPSGKHDENQRKN